MALPAIPAIIASAGLIPPWLAERSICATQLCQGSKMLQNTVKRSIWSGGCALVDHFRCVEQAAPNAKFSVMLVHVQTLKSESCDK